MERVKRLGKQKFVGLARTHLGWNVSTYSIKGNNVHTYTSRDTGTLRDANKEFTRQKRLEQNREYKRPRLVVKKHLRANRNYNDSMNDRINRVLGL